eukprot:PhM_4_TR675/c2_g1_i2/m.78873
MGCGSSSSNTSSASVVYDDSHASAKAKAKTKAAAAAAAACRTGGGVPAPNEPDNEPTTTKTMTKIINPTTTMEQEEQQFLSALRLSYGLDDDDDDEEEEEEEILDDDDDDDDDDSKAYAERIDIELLRLCHKVVTSSSTSVKKSQRPFKRFLRQICFQIVFVVPGGGGGSVGVLNERLSLSKSILQVVSEKKYWVNCCSFVSASIRDSLQQYLFLVDKSTPAGVHDGVRHLLQVLARSVLTTTATTIIITVDDANMWIKLLMRLVRNGLMCDETCAAASYYMEEVYICVRIILTQREMEDDFSECCKRVIVSFREAWNSPTATLPYKIVLLQFFSDVLETIDADAFHAANPETILNLLFDCAASESEQLVVSALSIWRFDALRELTRPFQTTLVPKGLVPALLRNFTPHWSPKACAALVATFDVMTSSRKEEDEDNDNNNNNNNFFFFFSFYYHDIRRSV